MMELLINGATTTVPDDTTVADLIDVLSLPDRGVAIAVDDAVVPKGRWATTALASQARVEILTAVQGG